MVYVFSANVVIEKNDNGNLKDSRKLIGVSRCAEKSDCFNIPGLPSFNIPGFGIPLALEESL
jgi:hypothetical protein